MVPGFVWFGALVVLLQLLVVGFTYGYVRHRSQVERPSTRRAGDRAVGGGTVLVAVGELAALGATGVVRVSALLSLGEAILVQNVGLVAALVGYLVVAGGFVVHWRATE